MSCITSRSNSDLSVGTAEERVWARVGSRSSTPSVAKQSTQAVLLLQALMRKECGLELAVGPAQLATSAYWTLRGASAFVAGKLGTTVTHVLQQHSMLHMTKVQCITVTKTHSMAEHMAI